MKNMKCYGKKKTIVPQEKSFIKDFFEGNESSNLFLKCSEAKDQGASASGYRENIYNIFDSPVSFKEAIALEQKNKFRVKSVAKPNEDQESYSTENKENTYNLFDSPVHCDEPLSGGEKTFGIRNAPKTKEAPKGRANRKKYVRKKVNGIQHLSTKYCKSLQPCWEEFEKHEFAIENPRKTNYPIITEECNHSKSSENAKNYTQSPLCTSIANNSNCEESNQSAALSRTTFITPKNIKSATSSTKRTLQSSGELFEKTHKYKTSMKKKNMKVRKTKLTKKYDDKLSYKMVTRLEEKIKKCMQNVDLPELCTENVNSYSESSSSKEKASNINGFLPYSALQETVPIQCSKTVSNASNIDGTLLSDSDLEETAPIQCSKKVSSIKNIHKSKGFCDTIDEVSRKNKNEEPVSPPKVHCISSNNEFSKNLLHKATYSKKCLVEQKLGQEFNNSVHFNNVNPSSSKFIDLCKDKNVADEGSEKVAFHNSNLKTDSDKTQKILTETGRILHSVDSGVPHRLITGTISSKPACINENEKKNIQSKPIKERKINDSMSNIDLLHESKYFLKSSVISLNKKVNSLNTEKKTLKNSMHKKGGFHALSPNVSSIIQNCKPFGIKLKGKFATSTPVTNKNNAHGFFNAEALKNTSSSKILENISPRKRIVLSDDESICEPKTNPNSSCEKTKENKHSTPLEKETLKNTSSTEILKSLQCPVTPNLLKSRTSLIMPSKNVIHSETHQNNQSLLNLSSINSVLDEKKSEDFTKAKLLELCDQDSVISFADIYDWKNLKVKKIGEGTYGEVFMLTKAKKSSVLKVIAISEDPNVKNLQGLSSVYSEIKISKSLSELRCNKINQSTNFVKIIKSSVVCGLYPDILMKAWDDFSMDRSTYNYRPDIYDQNQLFAILELEYGGKDMSYITLRNSVEAEIILKQIAVSLAIAEEEFSFEHRDLHLGNILVKRNRSKKVSYKIRGKDISFQCLGLQVTIIDFTLSLLSDKGYVYYYDLADDSLFDQTGDYQFDIYKSMRRHLEYVFD